MRTSRFDCPSASFTLKTLLGRTRQILWIGCALALLIHGGLSRFQWAAREQRTARPLTTRFVKRQPRLTKPLEMKKLPRPRRRSLQRRMVAVRARATAREPGIRVRPADVLGRLSRPHAAISRFTGLQGVAFEPREVAQHIQGARQPEQTISMSLDLVDLKALDTGEYQAMVIQDPTDKRNIKGFFHMARLRSRVMEFVATSGSLSWTEWIKNNSMIRVAEAVNQYTGIVTDYRDTFTPDDRKLLAVPLVFLMPTSNFELTENESQNLGLYLTSGGVLFADQGYQERVKSLYRAVEWALAAVSITPAEWQAEPLPDDHPLFHCFFDFHGAPPGGLYKVDGQADCPAYILDAQIKGVVLDGRVAAFISEKWYTYAWGAYGIKPSARWTSRPYEKIDATRVLQFGVNVVVFALTQEGSITHRLMESLR